MPVVVQGAATARKALKQINPDLSKEVSKEVGSLLKVITTRAKGFVPSSTPMSGWVNNDKNNRWSNRGFERSTILRGITYSAAPTKANKKGFRSVATIYNKSSAGAIYETAGRLSGVQGNFTPHLGGEIAGANQKKQGRLIFRAWSEDNGKVNAKVIKAVESTIKKATQAMGVAK